MPILRLAVILMAAGLALSACGVRGPLEPPPGAAAAATPAGPADPAEPAPEVAAEQPVLAGPDLDVFEDDEDAERVIQSQRRTRFPPMSDSFVLDPLL